MVVNESFKFAVASQRLRFSVVQLSYRVIIISILLKPSNCMRLSIPQTNKNLNCFNLLPLLIIINHGTIRRRELIQWIPESFSEDQT